MSDRDIFLIEVARRGRDGDYAGAAEVAALQSRATALEARPNITSLNAVPDVTITSPSNGQGIVLSGGQWVNATLPSGIPSINQGVGNQVGANVQELEFRPSHFTLSTPSANRVLVETTFAGTGTAETSARSDHTHTNLAPTRATFGPQAYMSSGTRALTSTSVTLPDGISCVITARLNMQMRGADPGACYYQLRITINGNARTSGAGVNGFWCVQGVPDKTTWEHDIEITGTGAAITVSADCIYHSGGGFYTDAGEIVVEVDTES